VTVPERRLTDDAAAVQSTADLQHFARKLSVNHDSSTTAWRSPGPPVKPPADSCSVCGMDVAQFGQSHDLCVMGANGTGISQRLFIESALCIVSATKELPVQVYRIGRRV